MIERPSSGRVKPEVDPLQFPVFITCRDRLTVLRRLVTWLEGAGHQQIVLVDNASTYRPLLEYLEQTPHRVEYLGANLGSQSTWQSGLVERFAAHSNYIVTDPDVVPDEGCPLDVAQFLTATLERFPTYIKAGLGLRIDDLPFTYAHRETVITYEQQYWDRRIRDQLYSAACDTTFAMYRPGPWPGIRPAIRTGKPYLARHLPWYADSTNPSDEDGYYESHADGHNSWTVPEEVAGYSQVKWRPMNPVERLRWRLGMWKEHRTS